MFILCTYTIWKYVAYTVFRAQLSKSGNQKHKAKETNKDHSPFCILLYVLNLIFKSHHWFISYPH